MLKSILNKEAPLSTEVLSVLHGLSHGPRTNEPYQQCRGLHCEIQVRPAALPSVLRSTSSSVHYACIFVKRYDLIRTSIALRRCSARQRKTPHIVGLPFALTLIMSHARIFVKSRQAYGGHSGTINDRAHTLTVRNGTGGRMVMQETSVRCSLYVRSSLTQYHSLLLRPQTEHGCSRPGVRR